MSHQRAAAVDIYHVHAEIVCVITLNCQKGETTILHCSFNKIRTCRNRYNNVKERTMSVCGNDKGAGSLLVVSGRSFGYTTTRKSQSIILR